MAQASTSTSTSSDGPPGPQAPGVMGSSALSKALGSHPEAFGCWDPQKSNDWKQQQVEKASLLRIKRDIMNIYSDPPPGMCVVPEEDITKVHALIIGPFDTPYEGGFFHFVIGFPPDYPHKPPRVKLLTTGNNRVRFNPNLYQSGKICLSILGTWPGPAWTPAQCLASVLISIQSLMNDYPYHNEPGYEKERHTGDSERYNECIQHETLRVAVCQMMENPHDSLPDSLKTAMEDLFPDNLLTYMKVIEEKIHLDGQPMMDPFGAQRGHYNYKNIKERLIAIRDRLAAKNDTKCSEDSSPLSDMDTE